MEETFPIPEGTVSPTHVHPPPPKMDSCAPCCFTVFVRLGFLRGGRSVSGDNPFPSPCISWVRNTGCMDLPRHPFGEFGLNSSWLLCQRESCPPRFALPFPKWSCHWQVTTWPGTILLYLDATMWPSSRLEPPRKWCHFLGCSENFVGLLHALVSFSAGI